MKKPRPNSPQTATDSQRKADRERKRRERAAQRGAGLVDIRLCATRAQRDQLWALLDRESLTNLRFPQRGLEALIKSPGRPKNTVSQPTVAAPKPVLSADASAPAKSRQRRKENTLLVIDPGQLDLFSK